MRLWMIVAAACLGLLIHMALLAASDPVVRHYVYRPAIWPAGVAPRRIVLMTDLHVSGPDMTTRRLARIVRQVNALAPDMVLLGGDYVSARKLAWRYPVAEALAPLARLRAGDGVYGVMGNHDHWSDGRAVRAALTDSGVMLLDNGAISRRGLTLGGVDDDFTDHADLAGTVAAMRKGGGIMVLLSHSPDVFPNTPADVGLILSGHTHCGQIVLPLIGPPFTASRFGRSFYCGLHRAGGTTLIVSGGVGTSLLPLRLGAPPEIAVIDVRPR